MSEKITKKHCMQFLKNPTIDPITKKKIVKGKSTYNKWMEKAQQFKSGGKKKKIINVKEYQNLMKMMNGPFILQDGVDIVKLPNHY